MGTGSMISRKTGGRAPIAGCMLPAVAILVVGGFTLDTLVEPEAATEASRIAEESGREAPQAPAAATAGVGGGGKDEGVPGKF